MRTKWSENMRKQADAGLLQKINETPRGITELPGIVEYGDDGVARIVDENDELFEFDIKNVTTESENTGENNLNTGTPQQTAATGDHQTGTSGENAENSNIAAESTGEDDPENKAENIVGRRITMMAIAQVAHEINQAFCESIGDHSQPSWEEAPEWQKTSAANGVLFHLSNPTADPSASHENWLKQKAAEGWKYGPVKNAETKEHPCFVPYDQLPVEQRSKDYLFKQVVHSLKPFLA